MLKISCLHTSQSNIALFEAVRRELKLDDVILKHRVRADLLADAEKAGGVTDTILDRAADELRSVAAGADGVLLTCSTIGAAAARAAPGIEAPVLRVDEALAEEATRNGGNIIVLCTVGTTIAPTRALFEAAAVASSATIEVRLVPGAWEFFRNGQHEDYFAAIAAAADTAADERVAGVALAQASMAGAARLARNEPLTSPMAGMRAIVAAAQAAATGAAPAS